MCQDPVGTTKSALFRLKNNNGPTHYKTYMRYFETSPCYRVLGFGHEKLEFHCCTIKVFAQLSGVRRCSAKRNCWEESVTQTDRSVLSGALSLTS